MMSWRFMMDLRREIHLESPCATKFAASPTLLSTCHSAMAQLLHQRITERYPGATLEVQTACLIQVLALNGRHKL